jgi:inositol-phosphate phosphatase/L-galactose 1-phosphate phosphatase/histidinol-phosphatase
MHYSASPHSPAFPPSHSRCEEAVNAVEYEQALAFAQYLADIGGQIACRYFRSALEISCKPDRSPVTAADFEVERTLRQLIHRRYPDHGIIGEEYGSMRSGDCTWVIDPIDGTDGFAMANPLFGILIGLLFQNEPIIGLIDLPALKERWIGDRKFTKFISSAQVHVANVSSCHVIEEAKLYFATPYQAPHTEALIIGNLCQRVAVARQGCDCYSYGLLASGYCDLVVESGLEPCDYLPLIPVITGAGGWITDWKGRPLGLDSGDRVIAAANKPLLDAAINALAT